MSQDHIRYDLLVQEALKGVVRKVMIDAATVGLAGDHHFYVSFRTTDAGVRISQRLRDKYPDEMTIVLQHQFWDLAVTEHAFEVGLSFSGIPERLLVPFDSITNFVDPSVQFGLKFEAALSDSADNDEEDEAEPTPRGALPSPARSEPARLAPAKAETGKAPAAETAKGKAPPDDPNLAKARPDKAADEKAGGAEVVRLDTFRKKT